jgi:hypothetical protein
MNSLSPVFLASIFGLGATIASTQVSVGQTLAIGMTVAPTGKLYVWSTPSTSRSAIGVEARGNEGWVAGGPASADRLTFWYVYFSDDLSGWTYQTSPYYSGGGLTPVSPGAPTLSFSSNPEGIAVGGSSTLTWSSTNATDCSGVGFSPSGVSGSLPVSPTNSTTYSITCTGSGGSTTRSWPVIVNPVPTTFAWTQSLPVAFHNPAIVPFGGTETRALVFMDGSLYAGIGDWEDPQLENAQTPGAQVLRLDSATSKWVEDQDFNQLIPYTKDKSYEAVSVLGTAHFDHDSGKTPITPVDVLMAGFWSFTAGVTIYEKTVKTGSVGAQGTWAKVLLSTQANGQVRAFASYIDSVTGVEMAFAGSSPDGIFSGGFDSSTNAIQWGAAGEPGSSNLTSSGGPAGRIMSFAACGGKLYATIYDAILARTDGPNPSWRIFYQYDGPVLPAKSSGFRGLTCVGNLNGVGSMLIAALESDTADIYDFPLDGSQPSIDLHTSNFLASELGAWVGYAIPAYNNMIVYPQSGTPSCPDLLVGLGVVWAGSYPGAYQGYYPNGSFLIRHCNGSTASGPSPTRASSRPPGSYRPAPWPCPNSAATLRERSMAVDTTRTACLRTIPIGSTGGLPIDEPLGVKSPRGL